MEGALVVSNVVRSKRVPSATIKTFILYIMHKYVNISLNNNIKFTMFIDLFIVAARKK